MYIFTISSHTWTHTHTHTHPHKLISNTAISSLKPFYPSIIYKLMSNWSVLQLYADPCNCIKEKRFVVVVASGPSPHPCLYYTVTAVPLHPSLLVRWKEPFLFFCGRFKLITVMWRYANFLNATLAYGGSHQPCLIWLQNVHLLK